MNDPQSDPSLTQMLNQFQVPMFAVERSFSGGAFRIVSLNRALERSSRCAEARVIGKSIFDVLPPGEARRAHAQYARCAASRSVVRFRDAFTLRGRKVFWDTTLQYAPRSANRDRVLGTSLKLHDGLEASDDVPAFQDIHYVSKMADFQLQNLISTFEAHRGLGLFTEGNEQRIARISGMCRTIQRAVHDIRKIVRRAQAVQHLQNELADTETTSLTRAGTLKAMTASTHEKTIQGS